MSLTRYMATVLAVFGLSLAVLAIGAPEHFPVASASGLLAVANTVAAYALVRWSDGRSTRAFMNAVLGGMLGRMAFLLGAVLVAVLGVRLPTIPFAVSLLGYFVLFLVFEMAVLRQHRPPVPAT